MYPCPLQRCPFPHATCNLHLMNFSADFPSALHPHMVSSWEAPSSLVAPGALTHVTKLAGLRGTAVTGVCRRQEGPGHPTNRPWQLAASAHIRGSRGALTHSRAAPKSALMPASPSWEEGFPGPAPAAGKGLQGHSGRGDKGTLILMVSRTRLACALGFKSHFGSSAAPPNPVLPPSSVGQQKGKGAESWPGFPAVSNPWQSL